jgi:hypothetical protein
MARSQTKGLFLAIVLVGSHGGCVRQPTIDPGTAPPADVPVLTEVQTSGQNPQTVPHRVARLFPNPPRPATPLGIPIGPFLVTSGQVDTGIFLVTSFPVNVSSTGKIDFGGAVAGSGAPILDANGDSWPTPTNYPAPNLSPAQRGRTSRSDRDDFENRLPTGGEKGLEAHSGGWNHECKENVPCLAPTVTTFRDMSGISPTVATADSSF